MQFEADDHVLVRMCGQIAEQVGDGCTQDKMNRFRAFLHELPDTASKDARFTSRHIALAAAACIAAIALSFLAIGTDDAPYRFWVGGVKSVGTLGERIVATGGKSRTVLFENGSTVTLQSGASAMVTRCSEDAVSVKLLEGDLKASVVGNGETEWSVVGGPFAVVVLGTEFSVAWDKRGEVFDVNVTRGVVRVDGLPSADGGLKVAKGYRLRVDRRKDTLEIAAVDPLGQNEPDPESVAEGDQEPSGAGETSSLTPFEETTVSVVAPGVGGSKETTPGQKNKAFQKAPSARFGRTRPLGARPHGGTDEEAGPSNARDDAWNDAPVNSRRTSSWRRFYESGDHSQAIREAEAEGIDELLDEVSLDDLWKLMHAARSVGRFAIAKAALLQCRERFATSKKARLSAFYLGKIEYEKLSDWQTSIRWFSTYLKENPSGSLTEEAEGRIMIAYQKMGRTDKAAQWAGDYLEKYPEGLFRVQAEALQ